MKTTTGMTEEEALSLVEKVSGQEHVKAEPVLNQGGKSYSVRLTNTRRKLSAKVASESQAGMLLLAWGVLDE